MTTNAVIGRRADALLDFAEWVRKQPLLARDGIDALVLQILSRATDSVEAVAVLVKQELPDQANVLTRTVFEDAVVTLWVTVNPDAASVLARREEHVSLWKTKIDQWAAGDWEGEGDQGRWPGSSHWTGHSIHTLLRQVDEWTREDEFLNELAAQLRQTYRDPLKLTQAFVHNSAFTMRPWQMTWQSGEVASAWTHRSNVSSGERALQEAFVYHWITSIAATLQISDEPAEEALAFFDDPTWRRIEVRMNANPDIGRNDPCPCGSGLKFKRCCGR